MFRGVTSIDFAEYNFIKNHVKVPDWCLYNMPDGLWFYSLVSSLGFIWGNKMCKTLFAWCFLSLSLSVLSEFLQVWNIIIGTFDYYDILAYLIATSLYILRLLSINPN